MILYKDDIMQTNTTLIEFYDRIAQDSKQALIQLISEAGQGKTSSMRSIMNHIKETQPDIEFVILDVSQAWYKKAPVKYRQLVTRDKINAGLIDYTVTDCVYEMGSLSDEERRWFTGKIVKHHYEQRYNAALNGTLESYKYLVFMFEESNIYFGSYSFRRNDDASSVFQNFASVGRNYRMRGFLIATVEMGEMAPSLRERTRKIYGRVISDRDLAVIRRKDKELADYLKSCPRYTFVYISDKPYGPVRIPDSSCGVPVDYVVSTSLNPMVEVKVVHGKWYYMACGALVVIGLLVGAFLFLVCVLTAVS